MQNRLSQAACCECKYHQISRLWSQWLAQAQAGGSGSPPFQVTSQDFKNCFLQNSLSQGAHCRNKWHKFSTPDSHCLMQAGPGVGSSLIQRLKQLRDKMPEKGSENRVGYATWGQNLKSLAFALNLSVVLDSSCVNWNKVFV